MAAPDETSKLDDAARAGWLYYIAGNTQDEIAKRLNVSIIELEAEETREAGRFRLRGEVRSPSLHGGLSSADELALILATSGTTSAPKLIPLTQAVVCYRALRARHIIDLTPLDRCLNLFPCFHGVATLVTILGSLFAGASVACRNEPRLGKGRHRPVHPRDPRKQRDPSQRRG